MLVGNYHSFFLPKIPTDVAEVTVARMRPSSDERKIDQSAKNDAFFQGPAPAVRLRFNSIIERERIRQYESYVQPLFMLTYMHALLHVR